MNVLIVEDELHTAKLLKDIIEEDDNFLVADIVESIVDAVAYLVKNQTSLDLLFFDIQLADGLSFEIFNHVDIYTPIIFCTAYDDYALKAIRNNGIDYIVKPFRNNEIHKSLIKYQTLVSKLKPKTHVTFSQEKTNYQQHFLSQFQERTIVIQLDHVAFFSIANEITYLHTFENKKHPIFKKLEHIESVTNPDQFFRINRQMLIRRKAIESYEPYFNRKVILHLSVKTDENPIVSRLKVSEFKKWLEQ
jgi:two-component system response regulator LytT